MSKVPAHWAPAHTVRRYQVGRRVVNEYTLPAHGYLEVIELRPVEFLLPNMDEGNPLHLYLYATQEGRHIPMSVDAVCRDVMERTDG